MIYTGVFFEENFNNKLDKKIQFPHVTNQFKPTKVDYSLFGQEVVFKVIGYGINEENEGYLVELVNATQEIKNAFANIEKLHITISVSQTGKPVNTKNLDFKPIQPFYLKGRYGGYEKNKVVY